MGLFDWMRGGNKRATTSERARAQRSDHEPQMVDLFEPTQPASLELVAVDPLRTQQQSMAGAIEESDQTVGGLDFTGAIQAHRNWKSRLAKYLANESDEKLDYRVICRDDQCLLGKWINGHGANDFGHLPSFGELKLTHGQFHLAAGQIVRMHDEKLTDQAQQALRAGDYSRYSIRVMGLISTLYVEVADTQKRAA